MMDEKRLEEKLPEEKMLEEKVWAVIGANVDPEKFGNKIFKKLLLRGYRAYPINPMYESIEGHSCYKDLSSLPEKPEVINMVVSPKRGKPVLEEAAKLGIKNIWFQPGTYDEELLAFAAAQGLTAVQACVLVATR